MQITAKNLSKDQIHPNDRKHWDTFIELEKDPTNPENQLTYNNLIFPLPSKIANGIATILDWQNGENPDNDDSRYPEWYKKWFNRNTLWDCHNFCLLYTSRCV